MPTRVSPDALLLEESSAPRELASATPVKALHPHEDRPDFLNRLLQSEAHGISPEMQALLLMQEFSLDADQVAQENAVEMESLMKLEPSAAFKALDVLMKKVAAQKLTTYLEAVVNARVPGGHPAFTADRAKNADHNSLKGLTPQSHEYKVWLHILGMVNDVKYAFMQAYIETPVAREHMHEASRLEYHHFREIADAVNELSMIWLQDSGSLMRTEERLAAGFEDELAAIRVDEPETDPRSFKEVKWSEAYPGLVAAAVTAYRNLAKALQEKAETAEGDDRELFVKKAAFYESVAAAYEQSTKAAFLKADALQPGQSLYRGDLPIHVATIETGYGKDQIQRIPEASLRYPDAEAQSVNEEALRIREDMERNLRQLLSESDYAEGVHDTVPLVGKTSFMATHFMGSGMDLYFLPAGQFLPNEAESRFEGGVSVTASLDSSVGRVPQFHDAFEAMFSPETVDLLFKRGSVDVKKMMARGTGSHEFGHAIGLTLSTYERTGKPLVNAFVEEWKATVGGMVLAEWRNYQNPDAKTEVTWEDLRDSLIKHVAGAGRYTRQRKSEAAQPYLRKSLMLVKVMEDAGVLFKDGEEWDFNLSEKEVHAVYQKLEAQYTELLKIYGEGNEADLRHFLAEHLQTSEFAKHMFASIDAAFPEDVKETMSLDEMCALPPLQN